MRQLLLAICLLITCTFCNSTDKTNFNGGANPENISAIGNSCDSIFSQQLHQVIDLIPTGFVDLEGKELILNNGETAYSSTLTLKETIHNKIGEMSGRPYYMAKIIEKVSENQAKELVKLWKAKMEICLQTPASQQIPYRTGGGKSELREGTLFLLDKQHGVSVYWTNEVDSENYDVAIAVI